MLLINYTRRILNFLPKEATSVLAPPPEVTPTEGDPLTLTLYNRQGVVEIVQCVLAHQGSLEIRRGLEGTQARDWPAGTAIASRPTAQVLKGLANQNGTLLEVPCTSRLGYSAGLYGVTVSLGFTDLLASCWDGSHHWLLFEGETGLRQYTAEMVPTGVVNPAPVGGSSESLGYYAGKVYTTMPGHTLREFLGETGTLTQDIPDWQSSTSLVTLGTVLHGTEHVYHMEYNLITKHITKTLWAQPVSSLAIYNGSLVGLVGREIWTLLGGRPLDKLSTTEVPEGSSLLSSGDRLWVSSDGQSAREIHPNSKQLLTGPGIGALLEVGQTVLTTKVSEVIDVNLVYLSQSVTDGQYLISNTPQSNDLATFGLGQNVIWRS